MIPHMLWVLKNIPIPAPICKIIKTKIDAGVYEPSNLSYYSRWFCVLKKDGKSLQLVHSLEPLNVVTIAHSGLPPAMEELAAHFTGRACGGILDLFVGYDERSLAELSWDLTTFQMLFGALHLVTLPMGWTNSVPIFHDNVTYILQDEIPHFTRPYIDDVPVRGPETRYELPGGGCKTIPENQGIRRFVWEHFQVLNRIVQRMKYSGGTFSGLKVVLCASEIIVVGHQCTYEGRKPETERMKVILNWGPCKELGDVQAFLGTCGTCCMFFKDYSKLAEPLTNLTRLKVLFQWGLDQEESMQALKDTLAKSPALRSVNYNWPIILCIDTSWWAVGFYICQSDPENPKTRYYCQFGSITLNECKANFSQPKRELYGLHLALIACKNWVWGSRNLIVETHAKYILGMLRNPDSVPNAAINRWIEAILLFQFKLVHVPGKVHGPDGLSRRDFQPGDDEYGRLEEDMEVEHDPLEYDASQEPVPLEFEEFSDRIDTRHGYVTITRALVDLETD